MPDTISMDRRALFTGIGALAAATPALARAATAPAAAAKPAAHAAAPLVRATAKSYPATQAFLDKYVDGKQLADCVIAIARDSHPVEYLAKGNIALDDPTPASPSSIFRVYSMSKPITGATFMTLVERGILRLDQPVSDVLPEFAKPTVMIDGDVTKTRPASGPILMRHLVTHTSGLSYGINQGPLATAYNRNGLGAGGRGVAAGLVRPTDLFPPARDLETFGRRLATLPLDSDPGTKWQYSVGLDLMGLIIQRASGMPFFDYMKQMILDPLGMHDTDFVVMGSKKDRLTSVYSGRNGALSVYDDRKTSAFLRDRDLPSGGGGLTSTAVDYGKFCQMLMNEGALGKVRVLKPETVRIERANHVDPNVDMNGTLAGAGNGFGVAMQVLGQASAAGEGAGTFGWDGAAGTTMWVDPVHKVSVVGMIQIQGGGLNIHAPLREAVYKDFRALGAVKG